MMANIRILGISAFYHDSAAAIIENGKLLAAAQEERFTRKKGDASFPHNAISFCLDTCNITERDIDHIVYYENPYIKFERLLYSYYHTAPFSLRSFLKAMPGWLTKKLWLESYIAKEMGVNKKVFLCNHHLSHAASAFFPSPFSEAAILTIDAVGEWATTSIGFGNSNHISLLKQIKFPNSLGLLYSAFTYYVGFRVNSGEYKLMGLAPYGNPLFTDIIKDKLIKINSDGSIIVNQKYFSYAGGLTMTNKKFHNLFGGPPRIPETDITQKEMDIAASIQQVTAEIILKMGQWVFECTAMENIVMAGGVALNCVANGQLSKNGPFKQMWIQPAAGDSGGAVGAALWFWHECLGKNRKIEHPDSMSGAFLGTNILNESQEDDKSLKKMNARWKVLDIETLTERIANEIAKGKIVAIARDKMEFGPRALGARSILGDARSDKMQRRMNLKIKFRESFRPFAPVVLEEDANQYFDLEQNSPYMQFAYPVANSKRTKMSDKGISGFALQSIRRSEIPAVTHVDLSARIQTVNRQQNPFMWLVVSKFKRKTGCSVIINTSFNIRGEPIVNTVQDAYRCFLVTEIDFLVIGNRLLDRKKQKENLLNLTEQKKWLQRFELD